MNLYQDIFFRGLDILRGRRTIERLRFLRQSQHWDQTTLRTWQLARLNELLLQARDHSDYYQKLLHQTSLPLRNIGDLAQLPILTKDRIQGNFKELQCRNMPRSRFVLARTGGSTGEPTYYYWDKRGMDWNRACVYRSAEWAGVALGERTIQMSGSRFDYNNAQKLLHRLTYFLQRYRDYSVAFMTEELLEKYFEGICRWQPTSIWGYASGIHALASYIRKHHAGASFDFLRALITSSETLRPEQRKLINEVFCDNKVFDHYGSREMYMGAECREHHGYHMHADVLLIEIVDRENRPCRPGELGRVLITDLSNQVFPFIRYEIGDVGVLADETPCACGVTLPRLARVEGRIADVLVLPDRLLTTPNIAVMISDMRGIKSYQIRQDTLDEIRLYIVPDSHYTEKVGRHIIDAFRQMTGDGIKIHLEIVPEIAVSESGKRRFIISTVSRERI